MAEALKKNLQIITSIIAILIGVTSLGAFAWKWGALVKEFEIFKETNRKEVAALEARITKENAAFEARIARIEQDGSYRLRRHEDLDDQREMTIKERQAKQDAILEFVPQLVTKLAVMDVKLDDLKSALDKHEKGTQKQ